MTTIKHSGDLGGIIDSFSSVARINNFVIEGHELSVGSKTTIWIKHPSPRVKPRDSSVFDRVICSSPCFDRKADDCREYISKEIVRKVQRWFHVFGEKKFPSTGLFSIEYLLTDYDKVYVAGFDGFTDLHHHYFAKKGDPSPHSSCAERAYLEKLKSEGRVVDLWESCRAIVKSV